MTEQAPTVPGQDDRQPGPGRTQRREATRHRILMAALQLVEQGRVPGELGLREVARAAGMAAPSIYYHFPDMDALGLALVDECLARLRAVARQARRQMAEENLDKAMKILTQRFLQYLTEYESMLRLLIMQWFNPNPEYRKIIRREMSIMRQEMAGNMVEAATLKGVAGGDFGVESDAIFSLLITFILNVMDLDKPKRLARLAILEQQIRLILAGSITLKGVH